MKCQQTSKWLTLFCQAFYHLRYLCVKKKKMASIPHHIFWLIQYKVMKCLVFTVKTSSVLDFGMQTWARAYCKASECPHTSEHVCDTQVFTFWGLIFCCTTSMKSSSERMKVVSAELLAGPWYTAPEPFFKSIAEEKQMDVLVRTWHL